MEKIDIQKQIALNIREIMALLDIEINDSNRETPKRIAKMLDEEIFANRSDSKGTLMKIIKQMTTFTNPQHGGAQPIEIKDIPFSSTCEHHWMPFMGKCSIMYVPDKKILGLSKFPRVVKFFSKKPQVQERLTQEILDFLQTVLEPKELVVRLYDVKHTCVSVRGIEAECSTDTIATFRRDK